MKFCNTPRHASHKTRSHSLMVEASDYSACANVASKAKIPRSAPAVLNGRCRARLDMSRFSRREDMEENSDKIWKVWKKNKLNSEKIWKICKKSQLTSAMIWKIWKKGKLNSGKIWKIKW